MALATTLFTIFGIGITVGGLIKGAIAVALTVTSMVMNNVYGGKLKNTKASESATYSGIQQTQTDQNLPIPLLYGTVKLAGNRIWQDEDGTKTVKRIVGFAEGEITDFSDIRLNDKPSNNIKVCSVNKYYGTDSQAVDSIVGGKNQAERVEKVGSLKNVAYLAISAPRSNDIDINYNLTAIVKGRKIRVYTTLTHYEVKYSENPAWVMFDFLTSYNGLGLALNNNGTISDEIIAELFDLTSFIEAAAFCDEKIPYTDSEGKTKYSPRFTFNMIFDSQTSARDLTNYVSFAQDLDSLNTTATYYKMHNKTTSSVQVKSVYTSGAISVQLLACGYIE